MYHHLEGSLLRNLAEIEAESFDCPGYFPSQNLWRGSPPALAIAEETF